MSLEDQLQKVSDQLKNISTISGEIHEHTAQLNTELDTTTQAAEKEKETLLQHAKDALTQAETTKAHIDTEVTNTLGRIKSLRDKVRACINEAKSKTEELDK